MFSEMKKCDTLPLAIDQKNDMYWWFVPRITVDVLYNTQW